jgi:hypothetical protein
MTLNEYTERVAKIVAQQQGIAQETAKLALSGMANPASPQFAELMTKQWSLIQELATLNANLMFGIMRPPRL